MLTTARIRSMSLLPTAALLALTGVGLAACAGGNAETAATPFAAPTVASVTGRWLHDPHGNVIGSVRGPADGGRSAVLMIGSYFRPDSHEVRVPASYLSFANGQVTLLDRSEEALNVLSRW